MNLVELISADGFIFNKVAGTHGGEYAGPCPFCGGEDRFRVWPRDKGGRFWCRGCNKSGDAIQYLRDAHDLTFQEACEKTGIPPRYSDYRPLKKGFTPRAIIPPVETWTKKGKSFLEETQSQLWRSAGSRARTFLRYRGLTDETLHRARLGLNERDVYFYRETWGLPVELKPNGKIKRLWLPAGIVIPAFDEGRLIRLRVRRFEPSGPRYVLIPGSCVTPLLWPCRRASNSDHPAGIVESELDGWLVWQEAADLCSILALGGVTMRPDEKAHKYLTAARLILNALDYDSAGCAQSWAFWPDTYGPKVKRWPVPIGKDPSDAYQGGLNIRAWIEAGLSD